MLASFFYTKYIQSINRSQLKYASGVLLHCLQEDSACVMVCTSYNFACEKQAEVSRSASLGYEVFVKVAYLYLCGYR